MTASAKPEFCMDEGLAKLPFPAGLAAIG